VKRGILSTFALLTAFLPAIAYAQTFPVSTKHIVVNEKTLSAPPSIVAKDSGNDTTFMPIWYVGKALEAMGVNQQWNYSSHTWALTTMKTFASVSNPGSGPTSITVNGHVVQKVSTIAYKDPSTGNDTVYMPIFYIIKLLKLLNVPANWDGTNWSIGTGWDARKNSLAGVYHPQRLQVIEPLKTVSGTVDDIRHESDKDYHINLKLDSQYTSLINAKNTEYENGDLVVEVIPMDADKIAIPTVGQHITVTGSYVLDKDHGWNEIHPAWIINGMGSPNYTDAAANASVQAGINGNGDEGSTTSTPTGTNDGSLKLVSSNVDVNPGDTASITIQTKPGTLANIEVDYSSGASHASGLEQKTSDVNGDVTWAWVVSTRTTLGDWKVIVTSNGNTLTETLHVK